MPIARLSPCGTFSVSTTRCMAVSHGGIACGRVKVVPWMLRRAHAESWMFPSPFPRDPTSKASCLPFSGYSHTLLFSFCLHFRSLIASFLYFPLGVSFCVPNFGADAKRQFGIQCDIQRFSARRLRLRLVERGGVGVRQGSLRVLSPFPLPLSPAQINEARFE